MESIELFRFCRVCLVPEEEERFRSIFSNGGEIAWKLNSLTGIYPVDVDEKVPSLVCKACVKEIEAADLLRKRILDANEHISIMTAEREVEMFEENLDELKASMKTGANFESDRTRQVNDKSEAAEPQISADVSTFFVPKIFLDRNQECEAKIGKLMTEKLKTLKPKPKRSKILKKKSKRPKKSKKTSREKIPTMFECDTCKKSFYSYQELNDHLESHKLDDVVVQTEPGQSFRVGKGDNRLEWNEAWRQIQHDVIEIC